MFMTKHFVPSSSDPITVQIGNGLSIRLYTSCLPNFLEVAPLQKGLVLMLDDKELIEEGMGFGVPVVKYQNKTYFSSSAKCYFETSEKCCTLEKIFVLDTISRKRIGKTHYINDEVYRFFRRLFETAYLGHKSLSPITNRAMELRKIIRINTEFIKAKSQGNIKLRYSFSPNTIQVQVNLSKIELEGCQEIIILNEQGADFFRKYSDADGLTLLNQKIGAWEMVKAKEASLSDVKRTLEFVLENKDEATLFRGREETKRRFSWSGLSYSLKSHVLVFDYCIRLRLSE